VSDSLQENMQSLPEDVEALRALVLATFAERDAAVIERDILQTQNDRLRHLLLKLTRMQFGARSERLPEGQLQLGLEALEQAIAKDEAEAEKRDPELRQDNAAKRRANRGALPAHLPRIEVTLAPEDTACPCCRAPMAVIGEDTSERLDVIPVQFRVIVTKRPKLACQAPGTCCGRRRVIDRGRHPDRGEGRASGGVTVCRPSAALPSGADHGTAGRHHRSFHSVVLDGLRRGQDTLSGRRRSSFAHATGVFRQGQTSSARRGGDRSGTTGVRLSHRLSGRVGA
jgi:transposase